MAMPWDKQNIPLDGSYNVGAEFNKNIAQKPQYQAGNVQGQRPQGMAQAPQGQSAGSVYGASQAGVSAAIAESVRLAKEAAAKWQSQQPAAQPSQSSATASSAPRQYKAFTYQAAANPYQGMKSEWERARFNRSMYQNQADSAINQRYQAARMRAQRQQSDPNAVFGAGRLLDLEMQAAQEQSKAWGDVQRSEESFDLRKASELDNFNRWRSQQMQSFANDDLRNAITGHQAEINLDYLPLQQDNAYKAALNQLAQGDERLNALRMQNQFAPQSYRDAEAQRALALAENQLRATYLAPALQRQQDNEIYAQGRQRQLDKAGDMERAIKPYLDMVNNARDKIESTITGMQQVAGSVLGIGLGNPAIGSALTGALGVQPSAGAQPSQPQSPMPAFAPYAPSYGFPNELQYAIPYQPYPPSFAGYPNAPYMGGY